MKAILTETRCRRIEPLILGKEGEGLTRRGARGTDHHKNSKDEGGNEYKRSDQRWHANPSA